MTWRNLATCLGEDPELFFPIATIGLAFVQFEEAKAICGRCEVVDTCLRWAMETGADTGVWGGLSDDERRSLKRRKARARVLSLVVGGQGRQRVPRLEGHRPGPALR
jgi:WhiB family transcriptional regulator, redox-sensing transcriptional regulator